jgi:hypothetical protein
MAPKFSKIAATYSDAWPAFNHVDFANLAFFLRNTGSLGKHLPRDVKKAIRRGFPSIVSLSLLRLLVLSTNH